ncbi:MAG: hypothetical protein WB770_05560, partial [Acidimicrobiales bacterium]
ICGDARAPIRLEALIAREDGHALVRGSCEGVDPEATGRSLADELLDQQGGRSFGARWAS